MYKRYYDGYGSYPQRTAYNGEVVIPEETVEETKTDETPVCDTSEAVPVAQISSNPLGGISRMLDGIAIDDIILLGVILLVLKDSADDPMLVIILAVIFLSGLKDK